MANYIINKGSQHAKTVEAEDYLLKDGYFWFQDVQGNDVVTYKAENVSSIWRVDK